MAGVEGRGARREGAGCGLALRAAISIALAASASAATLVVDTTVDAVDASPGDGACATAAGACSLRAAVQEANAIPGLDSITIPGGTYRLAIPGRNRDAREGDLNVTDAISITGAGAGLTILDANRLDRIFEFRAAASISGLTLTRGYRPWDQQGPSGGAVYAVTWPVVEPFTATDCAFVGNEAGQGSALDCQLCTIERCRFESNTTGGYATVLGRTLVANACTFVSNVGGSGGALVGDHLVVTDSVFDTNSARWGGAITIGSAASESSLVVRGTTFVGNQAENWGGAIMAIRTDIDISDSRFDGNFAVGFSPRGGAIMMNTGASATIRDTTFTRNQSSGDGGAISVGGGINYTAELTLERVTLSECTATGDGGAIAVGFRSGQAPAIARLEDCTLNDNEAAAGGGLFVASGSEASLLNSTVSGNSASQGGGIGVENDVAETEGGRVRILSSTVASNVASVGGGVDASGFAVAEMGGSILSGSFGGRDCAGTIVSLGHNVFGSATACALTGDTSTDRLGVNPLLGPLQDNGGSTLTHELLAGSPAIDAAVACADEAGIPLVRDQRGEARPDDGDGDGIAACDAGAVESCGRDSDGDGLGDWCDCAPADPTTLRIPDEADLRVGRDAATGDAVVSWQDLAPRAGSTVTIELASDSIGALRTRRVADAPCVATGVTSPWFDSRTIGATGWYYLARGVNPCGPADGERWGRDSLGFERPACP